jgi:hypothetical protein
MIIVDDALISEDILEKKFVCQLDKCKGACCVQGDAGAPLMHSEIKEIKDRLDQVKPYMMEESINKITKYDFWTRDRDGDLVTECMNDGACVFVNYRTDGTTECSIERAYMDGKIDYKKPVSCHLYPIRANKFGSYIAMNYHHWDICRDACIAGEDLKVPVYQFLKEALTRKMGAKWYEKLEEIARDWENEKNA